MGRWVRATTACVSMMAAVVVASCSGASTGSATSAAAGPATVASAAKAAKATGRSAVGTDLGAPEALAFDFSGNLYVSEFLGNYVDRITPGGSLTRVAGTGVQGYSGDGGPAVDSQLNLPAGLLVQPDGQLVIADHRND